jgi:lysophospholipase L1-like esterase
VEENRTTSDERGARRRELQLRYRRRRLTLVGVLIAALIAAGALLAGVVLGGNPTPDALAPTLSTPTACGPLQRAETGRPRWLTARRQTVLVDSVLLGGTAAMRERFKRWRMRIIGEPAIMLPAMEDRIAARRSVAKLVVIGIGYNSLWERRRKNYSLWARKFDGEARHLLATLRRKGARQFVWVTLRDARRRVIPRDAPWQYDRYAWYFPYVNERLRRLDRRRNDLVIAPWDEVSDGRGLTYDAIHLNPDGAALMAETIYRTIRGEARRQTTIAESEPDCG